MSRQPSWPGIHDKKGTDRLVKADDVLDVAYVPPSGLRIGDKIVAVSRADRLERDYIITVQSLRWTRRGTTLIVNGYHLFPRNTDVRFIMSHTKKVPTP